ncbi:hypothetical protein KP509_01G061700 [Ceratopteris richardii]|uniref:Metalloenzyme domain-containing protein n=1 Tax=Ceratopteris richardii TaxID=49495 RepID=A0A8T2VGV0_CERRI|nr:hypothetical protein KP509_01G061700 [Ceratopteris richardii]
MMEEGQAQHVRRRVVLVLVDGLGDVSIPTLGFQTPLQAAVTPNLDAIASAGINGLMDPVEPGLACGSDTAHLSLLGYDPRTYYRGRGAFESMGAGIAMSPGDIAFKCNFATIDDQTGIVTSRRADRHFEVEGPVLCSALDQIKLPSFPEYEVRVRYATEHRCGVVVKGPNLSGNISGTDPLKDNRPLEVVKPLDGTDAAKHTAAVVNELSHEMRQVLQAHPLSISRRSQGKNAANVVLLRGCGIRIQVPSFYEKHGLYPCMVAPTKIIAGLGLSLGIDILEAPGATGDYRTLLTSKAMAITKALTAPLSTVPQIFVPGDDTLSPGRKDGYDFGFLHIKAVDDAGHDKATALKVGALESIDKMIGQLAHLLWEAECTGHVKFSICVTGDHSTPVEYGDHSFEPVPFTMCHLEDFVKVRGGADIINGISLDPFTIRKSEFSGSKRHANPGAVGFAGDSVAYLDELAASKGCLGRFQGGEMMSVIKQFLQ